MSLTSNRITYKEQFLFGSSQGWLSLLLSLILVLPLGYIFIEMNLLLGFIALPIALIVLVLIIKYPNYWIYLVALTSPVYLMSDAEGFSVYDVVFAVIYNFGTVIWFVWNAGIKKKRIVWNSADFSILFFYFLGSISILIGYLNNVDLFYAFKEFALLSTLLIYFPFREEIKTPNQLKVIFVLLALSAIAIGLNTMYFYYKTVTEVIIYVYQLQHTIKTNQSVLASAAFTSMIFLFHKNLGKIKIFVGITTFITLLGLILSFSRGFWLIFAVGIIFIFLILEFRQKIVLITTSIVMLAAATFIAYTFFGDTADLIFQQVEKRFLSSTKGTSDRSIELRYKEYEALLSHAEEYPLGGNGSAKEYSHYNIEQGYTVRYAFSHSSYLQFFYKYGAVIPIFFFYFYIYYLARSIFLVYNVKDPYYKKLALSGFFAIFLLLTTSFIAAVVANRDGMFVMIFAMLIIGHVERHYQKQIEVSNT